MEISSLLMLFAVLLLVGLFVARPFYEKRKIARVTADDHILSSLMAERDRLITALQELDFDNTLGKIPAEDYPTQRALLLQKAADVLRQLDEFQPKKPGTKDAESRVEAVVAARRADAAQKKPAAQLASEDDIESLIAARRAERKEKSGGFCPKCGKPVLRTDRFCPSCGKPIK